MRLHVLDDQPTAATPRVKLAGAINETLSFSFSVTPSGGPLGGASFGFQPFASTAGHLDASGIEVFRLHAMALDRFPGWHIRAIPPAERQSVVFDLLVPLNAPRGGMPRTFVSGQTYHFWVDVPIPKGASPGLYSTRLELGTQGHALCGVDVELTVWPMVLPDAAPIPFIAEVDHRLLFEHHLDRAPAARAVDDWRDHPDALEYDRLLTDTMRLLQRHGLTPVLPELSPTVQIGAGGELSVKWDAYDAVVEPLLSGRAFYDRVPLAAWPVPVARLFAPRTASSRQAGVPDPFFKEYLAQCTEHFQERGWRNGYVLAPLFEGERVEPVEHVKRLASNMPRGGGLTLVTRRFPQDMAPYGWASFHPEDVSAFVGAWMPPAQFYDVEAMTNARRNGRRTWLSVDRPPFSGSLSIYAPDPHTRVLSWQAAQLGVEVLHVGRVNDWPAAQDRPTPKDCIRADPRTLLFPGRSFGLNAPVASVRLKRLRRSQQDAAYSRLLREHGREHIADALQRGLSGWAGSEAYRTHFADGRSIGWIEDPAAYDLARQVMAEAMLSAIEEPGASSTLAHTAVWQRFMAAVERVEMRIDGSRLHLIAAVPEVQLDIETQVTVTNRGRLPIFGALRFHDLPPGWRSAGDNGELSVPPGASRRVSLFASLTGPGAPIAGAVFPPIELATDGGEIHRRTAKASFLIAAPASRPPRVDGDLSDWPPGAENVAGDFSSISGQRIDNASDAARPPAKTFAFVQRDREHLYIGVLCETAAAQALPRSRRNNVLYDDLIPVEDEDLVEILIDPLNTGTRSAGDLYHIVVKRSGVNLAEKGILTDPPCAPHQPWPANIDVATDASSRRWVVEMRIPLAALDAPADENVIWGFNVTRWDAARQEFSTWSAAQANAYDPLSLGNLFLP